MVGRTYGYARVSTREQNLDRQLDALAAIRAAAALLSGPGGAREHLGQAECIASAKASGVRFGRPKKRRPSLYNNTRESYLARHITRSEAASHLKMSISTFDC